MATYWPNKDPRWHSDGVVTTYTCFEKKSKRIRTAFTSEQIMALEREFEKTRYIDRPRRLELSGHLMLNERQIKIWFQNRRMKDKKDKMELDSDTPSLLPQVLHPPQRCQSVNSTAIPVAGTSSSHMNMPVEVYEPPSMINPEYSFNNFPSTSNNNMMHFSMYNTLPSLGVHPTLQSYNYNSFNYTPNSLPTFNNTPTAQYVPESAGVHSSNYYNNMEPPETSVAQQSFSTAEQQVKEETKEDPSSDYTNALKKLHDNSEYQM